MFYFGFVFYYDGLDRSNSKSLSNDDDDGENNFWSHRRSKNDQKRRKHSFSCGHPLHSSLHSAKSKFYAENGKITYQKARLLAFVVGTGRTLIYIVVQVHLLVFKPTSCVQYNYVIYKHRSGWQHERVIIRRIKVARNSKDSLVLENSYS